MILIDTSVWIEFLCKRGKAEIKRRVADLIDRGEAAYCGPIQFEILSGARRSELPPIEKAFSFSTFLEFPSVCWAEAAKFDRNLREKGITVSRDDILIAAVAVYYRVAVYALDAHFQAIRDSAAGALKLI